MDDPDNPAPLHSDPRFLVATTLATLLLAGSAFICRTGSRGIWSAYNANHQPQPLGGPLLLLHGTAKRNTHCPYLGSESAGSSKTIATPGSAISLRHGHDYDPEAKDAKASRSKERRRRGKVPLKDLLKNPKKSKLLQPGKPTRSVEPLEEGRLPKIDEVMHDHGQPTAGPSSHENENSPDHEFETPSSSNSHLPSSPLPNTHNPSSSASSSTSTYPSSASASESATSPNTSPMLSQSLIDRTQETAAASAPSTPAPSIPKSKNKSKSKPGQVGAADPWDWDGAGPSSPGASGADSRDPTATPQRHKSPNQNQNQRGTPRDAGTGTSTSREWGSNAMSLPKLEEGEEEDAQGQVSMGTLNAQGTSTAPVITTTTSPSNAASSNTTTTNPPRRAPTPRDRRPPTPLSSLSVSSGSRSGSPPPQTQLASMRGALEAARMREERLGKEVEALRWEGGRARRREGELQAQIHHLMNQLQVYAAMLSGQVSPHPLSHPHQHQHPHPHQHQHIPAPPSTNGTNGVPPSPSINVNGYATAFSPPSSNPHSPPPPHPHPHLHIPSVQAQMLLNTIVPSPTMGFHGHTHSPHASSFYGAMVAGGGGVYPGSPMQASPWSMFSPVAGVGGGPGGVGGGGPVVGTGEGSGSGGEETESVGSESPDLDGEGAGAGGAERERGRRRTRTAGGRLGGWELEEGDGWVGNEERSGLEMEGKERIEDREGEDEEGLNEVLADAILKRPGSIRGLSRLGKVKGGAEKEKEKERESPLEEFRFPSISDFGNVVRVPVSMSMSIPEVFQPLYEARTEMDVEQEQAQTEQERVEPEQEVVLEDEDVAKTEGVSVDVVVDLEIVEEEEGKEDLTPPPLPTTQPTMTKTAAAKQSEDSDAAVDSDKGQREVVQS
ncbi:hypothetical protein C0995_016622 [Termitomyces sp. Mi166|nr:hypothetical protein C0995_016622 [Termitomyces sp. Mi166\